MTYNEQHRAEIGLGQAEFYQQALEESKRFRQEYRQRKGIVKAEDMLWENSPQGRIKHVVNEKMNTRECALDIYMQFLEAEGRSGKHRHLSEEIFFVLQGSGHDLHWDVDFNLVDEGYEWIWSESPKKFEWTEGDFVYIPPYTLHQHFNRDPEKPARILVTMSRIVKALGLNWIDQVENAPGYVT
ncbi:MAG: cupin domain-containing protein [Desulfobacterales bacterium]|nr:cupin domain-containing protein [Desulfobacterales bacterium]